MLLRNLITIVLVLVYVVEDVISKKKKNSGKDSTTPDAIAGFALIFLILLFIPRIIGGVFKYNLENHPPRTIIGKNYSRTYLNRTNQSQGADGTNQRQGATSRIRKGYEDEEARELVSVAYGPIYQERENHTWKARKEEAWNHVLSRSCSDGGVNDFDLQATKTLYMQAVEKVEAEALALYDLPTQQNLTSDEFKMMMVKDGCFLLQVALFVLDGFKDLKYPSHHSLFGIVANGNTAENERRSKIFRDAVSSMFVVGNQIPLVVLQALMQQRFFKDVINNGMWEQPLDLERWTLFELLVAPMLNVGLVGKAVSISTINLSQYVPFREKPYRILANSTLRLVCSTIMLLRFVPPFLFFYIWRRLHRVQKLTKRATDLLHGMWLLTTDGLDEYCYTTDSKDIYQEDDRCNHYSLVPRTVRSATELKAAGVKFHYQEGRMINGITLQTFMFNAFLILPRIVIDSNNRLCALRNLVQYEVINLSQSKRAVCEYLQLMRELVRSPEDAKHLTAEGIIILDPNLEAQEVPGLFKTLSLPAVRNHRSQITIARNQLHHRIRPSRLSTALGYLVNVVVLLTAIQTVYTVMGYHKDDHK